MKTFNSIDSLVDADAGIISREVFTNEEVYQQELEQIFARVWLFVGHESQVPNPGDFFVSRMGEESVILNRDRSDRIHVLLNSCRHRGMRVCRYDRGNTRGFTCPYHGWAYSDDRSLSGVPKLEPAYRQSLDTREWGLVQARSVNYRGFVFACWDDEAPSFEESLGEERFYLDDYIELPDGSHGPLEALGGVLKWRMPCNWKFAAENFAGDYYHNPSHASVDQVVLTPAGEPGRHTYDAVTEARDLWKLNVSIRPEGHGARGELFKDDYDYFPTYQDMAVVEDYFRDCYAKRQARLGDKARWFGQGGTIYPNVSYSNGVQSMGTWYPAGVHGTETWRIFLAPKNAPDEVKDVLRHYVIRYQGPSGLTEQDDMENWNYAHSASRGTIARRYPYSYEQGLGRERADFEIDGLKFPGLVTDLTEAKSSEDNLRNLYRRWADFMDADSWDTLAGWRNGNGR